MTITRAAFFTTCLIAFSTATADEFALMRSESIGTLKIGQNRAEALKAFVSKPIFGKIEEWGADGYFHQKATSLTEGLEISFVSESRNSKQAVESITIKLPCTFKTKLGIGIGSAYSDVAKAYRPHVDSEFTKPGKVLVAGSVYGGLSFLFRSGKVSQVFIGASAE